MNCDRCSSKRLGRKKLDPCEEKIQERHRAVLPEWMTTRIDIHTIHLFSFI